MSVPVFVTVDDSDVIQISYQGNWTSTHHAESDYLQTVHMSESSSASATFTFNGTSVKVFGTLPPSTPPSSKYTLDDLDPVTFVSPNVSEPVNQKQLYASPPLNDGKHTLVVQPILDGPNFYIDFLQYTPSPSSGSGSTSGSSSVAHSDAGKIAGGVIGGAVALGLVILAIVIFFRRRRNYPSAGSEPVDLAAGATPRMRLVATTTPFVPPPMTASSIAMSGRKFEPGSRGQPMTHGGLTSTASPTPTPSQVGTAAEASEAQDPIQHRDAGSVPLPLQREELPPSYDDRVEASAGISRLPQDGRGGSRNIGHNNGTQ